MVNARYSDAPDSRPEKGFTKEHLENTESILKSINKHLCDKIVRSRSLPIEFDDTMWQEINDYGTLTPPNTLEIGLIDYLPRIDPLELLLIFNKNDGERTVLKEKWPNETNFDKFTATKEISFQEYSSLLAKRKKADLKNLDLHKRIKDL